MDRRDVLKMLAGAAALGGCPAWAQDGFPSRMMKVVVAYPPGGVTDIAGRLMAEILSKELGKPAIVENKGGGTGTIAQQYVLQQPHDGHVLLSGGLGGLILPVILNPNLPVDPQASFTPVAQVAEFVNVLLVGRDVQARNVSELIEHAKANPGKLNYATNGVGTSAHFTSELFNLQAGTKVIHIPYRSSGEVISGLRNGDVHMAFANAPAVNALVKAGTLRAIAVTSAQRTKDLPDVPTMVESGMPDFVVTSWLGAYAAAGTPPDVIRKLSEIIVRGAQQPENVQRFETVGFQVSTKDAAAYAAFNRAELARWKDVARLAIIRAEG